MTTPNTSDRKHEYIVNDGFAMNRDTRDNKWYGVRIAPTYEAPPAGSVVELTDEEAKKFVELGVVERLATREAPKP